MQQLRLGAEAARKVEIFEQFARFTEAERLWRRSPIENFERTLAGISMRAGDAMKLRIVDARGGLQRAKDDSPPNLQCAQITLGKRSSGEVESRDRKLLARQAAKVIGKQPNFFQFCGSRSDGFTNVRKREKFRWGIRRFLRKRVFS